MKKLIFLLCCIFSLSCSEEQSNYANKEKQNYQKVNSLELQQQLMSYLNETQEIIYTKVQSSDEEMNL